MKDARSPFRKLADPNTYLATTWDLATEPIGREHWTNFFKRHLITILKMGVESAVEAGIDHSVALANADRVKTEFYQRADAFLANPGGYGRVTLLRLDEWRDGLLREHGFPDAFAAMKNRENEKMLPLLPAVCREIDACVGREQLNAVILGLFAGNIFDMGAEATAHKFLANGPDFFAVRSSIMPRPWLIDDYDRLSDRLLHGPRHRKAIFFIDNAGSDFVLGAVPMIRWLAQRGTRVVMAANARPTLNDMYIEDVRRWWPRLVEVEPSLAGLPIEFVSTGTDEPLIDLSAVSAELNAAAADADLVILEGMGRGIETNLDAEFSCDALNIAMIKDSVIAARRGGKVFDVVCRFR
jgi:type II pantothenate kinase